MRLVKDTSPGAYAVQVRCLKCGKWRDLSDVVADLDGPAFKAYYCDPEHRPDRTPAERWL